VIVSILNCSIDHRNNFRSLSFLPGKSDDSVQYGLSFCSELLPMLPSDGIFEIDAIMCKSQSASVLDMPQAQWFWKDDNNFWQAYSNFDSRVLEVLLIGCPRCIRSPWSVICKFYWLKTIKFAYFLFIKHCLTFWQFSAGCPGIRTWSIVAYAWSSLSNRYWTLNSNQWNDRKCSSSSTSRNYTSNTQMYIVSSLNNVHILFLAQKQTNSEQDKRKELLNTNKALIDNIVKLLFPILVEIDGSSVLSFIWTI
jgi:hypothetical protein